MGTAARLTLAAGVLGLALSITNQLTAPELSPALERAAVLASFLAVGLMLVAILWTRAMPEAPGRVALKGEQGLVLDGLGIEAPCVISLAKREEEVFVPGRSEPLRLSRDSYSLRLLEYVRDEAHRFAQHYHHLLRGRRTLEE